MFLPAIALLLAGCATPQTSDYVHAPCWLEEATPAGAESAELASAAVEAWNARDPSHAYGNSYGATPLPSGTDEVTVGAFVATGNVWTVTSGEGGDEIDAVGCLAGDRIVVEGRMDLASAAAYFDVADLPLYLDAPASLEGQFGVFPGNDSGTMERHRYLGDAAVTPGEELEGALEAALAERGEGWAEDAVWEFGIELGDVSGRVIFTAYDPAFVSSDDPDDAHSVDVLDGTFNPPAPTSP